MNKGTGMARRKRVNNIPPKITPPRIQTVPIGKLKPWKGNPRTGHAVEAIQKSIESFGYLAPIIVQKGTMRILAGHGRLEALKAGGAQEVPVVIAKVTDKEATAYTVADNALTDISDWDDKRLTEALKTLDDELSREVGIDDQKLQRLLNETDEVDNRPRGKAAKWKPSDIPEPNSETLRHIFSRIKITPKCWIWRGALHKKTGYPVSVVIGDSLKNDGKKFRPQRVLFHWIKQAIPKDYTVDHFKCKTGHASIPFTLKL